MNLGLTGRTDSLSKSIPRTEDRTWRWRTWVQSGREGAGLGAAQCTHLQQQPLLELRACDSWHSRVAPSSHLRAQVPQKHLCFEAASPSRGCCALSPGETSFSVPHEPHCPVWRQVRWTSGVFVPTWSTFPPIHPVLRAFT